MRGRKQKLLYPFGRISDSPMLGQLDMSLILSSLFLILIRHVHSQTRYQNHVMNIQWTYHIFPYKDWLMAWQTSIIDSGTWDFVDWIISATIHLENPANTEMTSGKVSWCICTIYSNQQCLNQSQYFVQTGCSVLEQMKTQIKSGKCYFTCIYFVVHQ